MKSTLKKCNRCNIWKPQCDFYNNKPSKSGKLSICKTCIRKQNIEYHRKHPLLKSKRCKEYYNKIGRTKQGHQSMEDNKNCSSYLGVVIAERLCRHIFKDVTVMPNCNVGYDIICGKGKKIDVKSGCITMNNKYPVWEFAIKKNKIADYFICIAFDNRIDLNPLHVWLIPGNEINQNMGVSIRQSTLYKWDKWAHNINDAKICCTELKNISDIKAESNKCATV